MTTPFEKCNVPEQDKDKHKVTQLETIFSYWEKHIATASMVAEATGIYQKNICRYKRDLEKLGRLWEIEKSTCKKTGFKAWYVTCDPSKVVNVEPQLKLF